MGIISFLAPNSDLGQNVFPPASLFDPKRDMPDLTGKTVIVTGGNSGIGYESMKHLLNKNATVYMASRNLKKASEANAELKKLTGKEAILLQLDLADLTSVRKAAEEFLSKEKKLDILFNNGGIMGVPITELTAQGYDSTFGTNVLGHYHFTTLLVPALIEAGKLSGEKARIVNTSSALASRAPKTPSGINWKSLKDGPERLAAMKEIEGIPTYGQSKLGNAILSGIFNNLYGDKIASCSLHPGVLKSNLGTEHRGALLQALVNVVLWPTEYGPLTQLYAGTALSAEEMQGKYLVPWARVGTPFPKAESRENQDELQKWLEAQVVGF